MTEGISTAGTVATMRYAGHLDEALATHREALDRAAEAGERDEQVRVHEGIARTRELLAASG